MANSNGKNVLDDFIDYVAPRVRPYLDIAPDSKMPKSIKDFQINRKLSKASTLDRNDISKIRNSRSFLNKLFKNNSNKKRQSKDSPNSEKPVLRIRDNRKFLKALQKYEKAINSSNHIWTQIPEQPEQRVAQCIYYALWNGTVEDLKKPEDLFERYMAFFSDKTFQEYDQLTELGVISALKDSRLFVQRVPQRSGFETPYTLDFFIAQAYNSEPVIENGNFTNTALVYRLPSVMYGIQKNESGKKVCYIYAVQGENKSKTEGSQKAEPERAPNAYQKFNTKVNKDLYQVNKGVPGQNNSKDYNEDGSENICRVTPSAIVALSAALGMIKSKGIENLEVPYWPYLSSCWRKENYPPQKYERAQENITKKMRRNFLRLEHHFKNVNVTSLAGDLSDYTKVSMTKEKENICNNEILNQVYSLARNHERSIGLEK